MGKGVKALIIILVLAVIGLAAYIVLDKTVLNKETSKESSNVTTNNTNSITDDTTNDNTNATNVAGLYKFEKNITQGNTGIVYKLCLYDDGTYSYTKSIYAPSGSMGTYAVSGDTLILTEKYLTGSDVSLGVYKNPVTKILNINSDGSISDKNTTENKNFIGELATTENIDYSNIILTRATAAEETEYFNVNKTITERVNSIPEDFRYIVEEQNANISTNQATTSNGTTELTDSKNGETAFEKIVSNKSLETEQHGDYYTYVDQFQNKYDIKEIIGYTCNEKGMLSNDKNTALYKVIVTYLDSTGDTKIVDLAITMNTSGEAGCQGTYVNYTGTTNFVKTFSDLYNDGTTNNQ